MSDLVFIDVETTGVDPERHCLWEIAIVTDRGAYCWILELSPQELGTADSMALAIGRYYERSTRAAIDDATEHARRFGISPFVNDIGTEEFRLRMQQTRYITEATRPVLASFLAHEIGTAHLVGAVPSFDARFVGDFMRDHDHPPAWHYHLVDVEALAAGKLQHQPPWKSKDLYRDLGVDPGYFNEHTALGDACMAKAVYERVMGLRSSYPEAIIGELSKSQGGDRSPQEATV